MKTNDEPHIAVETDLHPVQKVIIQETNLLCWLQALSNATQQKCKIHPIQ